MIRINRLLGVNLPTDYHDARRMAIDEITRATCKPVTLHSQHTDSGCCFSLREYPDAFEGCVDGHFYLSKRAPYIFAYVIEATGEYKILAFQEPWQVKGQDKRAYNKHAAFAREYIEKTHLQCMLRISDKQTTAQAITIAELTAKQGTGNGDA